MKHQNFYVQLVASTACLQFLGSFRFAHLQRSELQTIQAWYVQGLSARGKRRVGGVRIPFAWSTPRFMFSGGDPTKALQRAADILRLDLAPGDHFLLPDFEHRGASLEHITSLSPRPMTGKRYIALLKELVSASPYNLEWSEVSMYTQHSMRRGLPSLADRCLYAPSEQLSIGLWSANAAITDEQ